MIIGKDHVKKARIGAWGLFLSFTLIGQIHLVYAQGSPPSKRDIVSALITNHVAPLPEDPSCENLWPTEPAETVGDHLAALLAAAASPDFEEGRLTVESEPSTWPKTGANTWKCRVEFSSNDAQSPWEYGLTFHLDAKSGKLIPESIRCPGLS